MEGVGGVNNAEEQLLPGQRRYEESRKLLTGEVNAAVSGALAAGAGEVVIWDGHNSSRSLSIDEIHPRAKLIQGDPRPGTTISPENSTTALCSRASTPWRAPRTVYSRTPRAASRTFSFNGKPLGEIGQVAAIGGYFEIPSSCWQATRRRATNSSTSSRKERPWQSSAWPEAGPL